MPHALIVDDNVDTRDVLREIVSAEGFTVSCAGTVRDAQIQMLLCQPDVVLVDLSLPDGSGMDIFSDIETPGSMQIVMVTGHASVETAIEALRMGAADYLTKPVNFRRLKSVLSRVPHGPVVHAEIGSLRNSIGKTGRFGSMLGNSAPMQGLYDQIARVAPTEATVLLLGESGTGKEVAAQTIHALSLRQKKSFIAVNCGAISPQLIESEIFGHEKGSFTGADRQHKGYFERANGGTLFLDEITEMPAELQVKLLRVLETGTFMRIGSSQDLETDVRIIAATNRNPEEAITDGKLRLDLYHRLNVFPMMIPPLRERGPDIELLARHFLEELNDAHGTGKGFSEEAIRCLQNSRWPGNVRELRNCVQRAYIMSDRSITTDALAPAFAARLPSGATLAIPVGTPLAEVDRRLILATLEVCGGVKKRAAEVLGISLKTLYNRLEEYGTDDEDETAARTQAVSADDWLLGANEI